MDFGRWRRYYNHDVPNNNNNFNCDDCNCHYVNHHDHYFHDYYNFDDHY